MHPSIKVLLATDQPNVANSIKSALCHGVYATHCASSLEQVSAAVRESPPHLAIVDVDMTGGDIASDILTDPSNSSHPPIIAVSRKTDLTTKLSVFEQGADDIVVLPFSPEEFNARCQAIVRRTLHDASFLAPVLRRGELEIDLPNRRVTVSGDEPHLTWLEQRLLYLLATNAGRVVTRDEILDQLWGTDYLPESNVVDRHIRNLRNRLKDSWRKPRFIATVAGQGYRFVYSLAVLAFAAAMDLSRDYTPWLSDLGSDIVDIVMVLPV